METFTSALKYNQKVTDETDQFRDGRVRTFLDDLLLFRGKLVTHSCLIEKAFCNNP